MTDARSLALVAVHQSVLVGMLAAVACEAGDGIPSATSLLCDVDSGPSMHAVYAESIEPFSCDPFAPPSVPTEGQAPVLVGRSGRGDIFVLDRLSILQQRLFGASPGESFSLIDQDTIHDTVDDVELVRLIAASDPLLDGLAILAPKVGGPGAITLDFSRAEVSVAYDPSIIYESTPRQALSAGDPLVPIEGCEDYVDQLPDREKWMGVEYFYEVEDGDVIVVMELLDFLEHPTTPEYFVFYGPPDGLRQYPMTRLLRYLDGKTDFYFELPMGTAHVSHEASCDESRVGSLCPAALSVGGSTLALASRLLDATSMASSMSFYCQFLVEPTTL